MSLTDDVHEVEAGAAVASTTWTGAEVAATGSGAEVAATGSGTTGETSTPYWSPEFIVCSIPVNEENTEFTVTTSPLEEVRRKERGKPNPVLEGALYGQYPQPAIGPDKGVHTVEPASLISIDDVVDAASITVTANQ